MSEQEFSLVADESGEDENGFPRVLNVFATTGESNEPQTFQLVKRKWECGCEELLMRQEVDPVEQTIWADANVRSIVLRSCSSQNTCEPGTPMPLWVTAGKESVGAKFVDMVVEVVLTEKGPAPAAQWLTTEMERQNLDPLMKLLERIFGIAPRDSQGPQGG